MFDVQSEFNSSHFTAIRLLRYLAEQRDVASVEGVGFDELNKVIRLFDDLFFNRNDLKKTILKLISPNRQLVELDTRMTDSLAGSSYIRITPAGYFYQDTLYNKFPYLDLIWQDTPINNPTISHQLATVIHAIDLEKRFLRVEFFLNYLEEEENAEFEQYGLDKIESPLTEKIMPRIRKSFNHQLIYIREKKGQKKSDS